VRDGAKEGEQERKREKGRRDKGKKERRRDAETQRFFGPVIQGVRAS
jgi:hypothetical protein